MTTITVNSSWQEITNKRAFGFFTIYMEEIEYNKCSGSIIFSEQGNINATEIHIVSYRGVNKPCSLLPCNFIFEEFPDRKYEIKRNINNYIEVRLLEGADIQVKFTIVTTGEKGTNDATLPLSFNYTQMNGNGIETSSNSWKRVGICRYGGSTIENPMINAYAIMYTTNTNSYHRIRLQDVTNNLTIATSTQSNAGTVANPIFVNLGTISNVPVSTVLVEIQILSTDATGNTGVNGRQNIGILTIQIYS